MGNPLSDYLSERRSGSANNLLAWCEETNAKPAMKRMGRWYFVVDHEGGQKIDSLDGTDGINLRREIAGTLPDFVGWSDERMRGYRRWLRDCAERGTTSLERAA